MLDTYECNRSYFNVGSIYKHMPLTEFILKWKLIFCIMLHKKTLVEYIILGNLKKRIAHT